MTLILNPSSGVPIYLQLMEQIKHALATGALQPGDQLPGLRKLAETLVINPNTVAKAYRELEHEGVIELRQGSGAYIAEGAVSGDRRPVQEAQRMTREFVEELTRRGLSEEEIRRLVEAALLERMQQEAADGQ